MNNAQAREIIQQRGLKLEPFGVGFRVRGPGADLLLRDLGVLSRVDLEPTWARSFALTA